ncbi:DUF190 domain-containing protein [Prolixibacter sp. NT017]|uniref:DUF190 domain-containing protein n=1 Tax=Prolixibacter sp. NT017 TaxID=2652390 RepID=UPI001274DEC8|nr:DUF190 domain-containing protein [Prolixibacter sp. NT017]GET25986.1 hypothetical protein NT017_23150 [Prolixibacter sp. NT017]
MEKSNKTLLLRIFIGSTDKLGNDSLYESLVFKAKKAGLAGSTVVKGVMGFGASSVIHSYKFWEVAEKLPTIVEIIDEEEKVMAFYETIKSDLETMRYGCLVTVEEVTVLLNKAGQKREFYF